MQPWLIALVLGTYFGALVLVAWLTSRHSDSESFFLANRKAPWPLVAFGMVGASLSGVTFISVPGQVATKGFSYLWVVLGYVIGYFIVAGVLMPIYYRLRVISIYTFLRERFDDTTHLTGTWLFLVSRTLGSALRLYLAAHVLDLFLFSRLGIPFVVTVFFTLALIWLYTHRGGIKTIVWTDTFQTFFLLASLVATLIALSGKMNISLPQLGSFVASHPHSRLFLDEQNILTVLWTHIVPGILLTLCMTGLDQDLMQKNLSCPNLNDARKNMYSFSIILLVTNVLFVSLGVLLYAYVDYSALTAPAKADDLFPTLALGELGVATGIFFLLGITASSYASADSALAALTTSFCIDILKVKSLSEEKINRTKNIVLISFSALFGVIIVIAERLQTDALITQVLTLAGYTYGPLFGMFVLGIFTDRKLQSRWVPVAALAAPLVAFAIIKWIENQWGYKTIFDTININALTGCVAMWWVSKKKG